MRKSDNTPVADQPAERPAAQQPARPARVVGAEAFDFDEQPAARPAGQADDAAFAAVVEWLSAGDDGPAVGRPAARQAPPVEPVEADDEIEDEADDEIEDEADDERERQRAARRGVGSFAAAQRRGYVAGRVGRVTGTAGVVDALLVTVAILFLEWLLLNGWKFGADYTLFLFAQLGLDMRAWIVQLPIIDQPFNAGYLLPLAVGGYQWVICPYYWSWKRPGGFLGFHRNKRVAGWAFWVWWVLFVLDVGSSFGGVWGYIDGRTVTLFAQELRPTATGYGVALMIPLSIVGAVFCAFAPERVGRPAMADLYQTLRSQVYYWLRLDPKHDGFFPRRLNVRAAR